MPSASQTTGARPHPHLRLHADALHGSRRGGADPQAARGAGAHRAVGDRRRLRRQARHLHPAAAGGRRVEARSPGALRLHAAGVDAVDHQAPSRRTCSARFACDAEGRLIAADFFGDFNTGAYASWGNTVANRVPIHAIGPVLRSQRARADARGLHQRPDRRRVPRLRRAAVDHRARSAARRSGRADRHRPLEFRCCNAIRAGQPTATGQVLRASAGLHAVPDRAQAGLGRGARPRRPDSTPASSARRLAARQPPRGGYRLHVVRHRQHRDRQSIDHSRGPAPQTGRVFLYNGAVDIGQGSSTILPQICADALGLPVHLFDQVMGDTDLTADAGKSSASRQTFVSGNAARFAGEALRASCWRLLGAPADASCGSRSVRYCARGRREWRIDLRCAAGGRRRRTLPRAKATSIRRPRRSMQMARACPTRPTASPRRSPRSRSIWSWAP